MTEAPGADAAKDEWRRWARMRREACDWESLSQAIVSGLAAWPPLQAARTVLAFLPMRGEVDLRELLEGGDGARMVVTRTPEDGDLTIHELGGPLEVHRWGFLQPHASAPRVPPEEVDVWLVPGLAFDIRGTRLGNGAGYFDSLLAGARRGAFIVGVVPVGLVADRLPAEPHDVPMGYLATEEGVIGVASSMGQV